MQPGKRENGEPVSQEQAAGETRRAFPWPAVLLAALLLLAAALRFYRLDAQSFWNDEGNSARLAERSLASITIGTASDIHPPLYYYALHFWRALLGQSEFALRALSVLCGLALVGLIYIIARRLFDEPAALVAALIAAVNPFQIYYSQEARMYAMLAMWAAASTYGVLCLMLSPGSRLPRSTFHVAGSALYILSAAAGLYTQYTFVFMLLVHNLLALISLAIWREHRLRRALAWAALQAAVVVLYLPWLPVALARAGGWGVEPESYTLGAALLDVARLFAYGVTLPTPQAGVGLVAAGAFVLAGLWWGRKTLKVEMASLIVWWLVPVGLMFGLGLYRGAYVKFLLMSSAPACVLMGHGAVSAWRAAGHYVPFPELTGRGSPAQSMQALVGMLAVLAAFPLTQSLSNLYFDPAYARDDYRGLAQFVRSLEQPGDAVLLIAPNQWEVFTYYYAQADRVYPLARQRPPDPAAVDAELREIAGRHARLFVLYWGDSEADPHRVYEAWLAAHTFKAGEQWWGKVRLALYAVSPSPADAPLQPLEARFGEHVVLRGYTLLTPQVSADGMLQLALFWRTEAPVAERYKVFVHLVNSAGQIAAQVDREPGADLAPTTTWSPGQTIVDRYAVLVPAGTPPGGYTLVVGLYGFDGQRLPITQAGQGDALRLAEVEIR